MDCEIIPHFYECVVVWQDPLIGNVSIASSIAMLTVWAMLPRPSTQVCLFVW